MPRFSSVQIFSDRDTKVVSGYVGPDAAAVSSGGVSETNKQTKQAGRSVKSPRVDVERPTMTKGSCAGADSGAFDRYRLARNRERERLEQIELGARKEAEEEVFAAKVERNKRIADDRTERNRLKRQKKRAKASQRKLTTGANDNASTSESDDESDETTHVKPEVVLNTAQSTVSGSSSVSITA